MTARKAPKNKSQNRGKKSTVEIVVPKNQSHTIYHHNPPRIPPRFSHHKTPETPLNTQPPPQTKKGLKTRLS
jgi:hypothetical protein